MAELKTQKTKASVKDFLATVEDEQKRRDCQQVDKLMAKITGRKAAMWGSSIVGYGSYHYKYASGQEGDWPLCGFAPRKQNLVLYIMSGFERQAELMERLGKYKTGKSCLYLRRLEDVDLDVLAELVRESVAYMRANYATT
ncbi:MAG TPA: DUF1801 domain-containing protein [Xanthomonadales bacterium]|nr:DUF1801 domain-containing protein [Xanthomonadales bacterium]